MIPKYLINSIVIVGSNVSNMSLISDKINICLLGLRDGPSLVEANSQKHALEIRKTKIL